MSYKPTNKNIDEVQFEIGTAIAYLALLRDNLAIYSPEEIKSGLAQAVSNLQDQRQLLREWNVSEKQEDMK